MTLPEYADRLIYAAGAVALAALLGVQSYSIWSAKGELADRLSEAKTLVEQAESNNLPQPSLSPETQSGRVFRAWETLPAVGRQLSAWDFYPNPSLGGQ